MAAAIGISCEGGQPPAALRDLAGAADGLGVGRLWVASHLFQREPVVSSAMVLGHTRQLGAALMAMSPYTVHPVYATMAAAALDEWFPGRVTLCFGAGAPRDLAALGIVAERPLGAIRESIEIARSLLAGETVQYQGKRFRAEGRRLNSGPHDVPIMLAASGPKMLQLAGEVADGVLISAATSPPFVAWALDHVRDGEARSGRQVHKAALVYTAVSPDGQAARDRLRRNLAFVLRGAHHAQNLALAGTRLDQAALNDAYASEDWKAVAALIDDAVLDNHTASGTPQAVRAAMRRYEAVGLDEIVLAGIPEAADLRLILG